MLREREHEADGVAAGAAAPGGVLATAPGGVLATAPGGVLGGAPERAPARPFGHFRLAAFFAAVGLGCAALAALGLASAGAESQPPSTYAIAAGAALLAALLGFAGVFFHRLRVNPIRWHETETYLLRIQRESEKYRALLEGAADMLLVVDPATRVVRECNALARETLGLAVRAGRVSAREPAPVEAGQAAAPARSPEPAPVRLETFVERGAEALDEALARALAAPGTPISVADLVFRGAAGGRLAIDARAAAVGFGGERALLVSLRDVTRQKELERELATRERLSTIGLMTAGVAHDINNPLEGIGNYLSLLGREGLTEEQRQRYLERLREGFGRIREIVRDLLRFARPEGGHERVDLVGVVQRAQGLFSFAEGARGVEIELEGLSEPLHVVGDSGRLEQVVFNLLANAGAALRPRGGGRVRISARRIGPDARRPLAVELSVADSGPGIDPADLERIFDPFFTRTGGTGLGLAVCFAIARAHGGTLAAHNRPEGGAELCLRLPAQGADRPGPGQRK